MREKLNSAAFFQLPCVIVFFWFCWVVLKVNPVTTLTLEILIPSSFWTTYKMRTSCYTCKDSASALSSARMLMKCQRKNRRGVCVGSKAHLYFGLWRPWTLHCNPFLFHRNWKGRQWTRQWAFFLFFPPPAFFYWGINVNWAFLHIWRLLYFCGSLCAFYKMKQKRVNVLKDASFPARLSLLYFFRFRNS